MAERKEPGFLDVLDFIAYRVDTIPGYRLASTRLEARITRRDGLYGDDLPTFLIFRRSDLREAEVRHEKHDVARPGGTGGREADCG
jgi:hypothetical protein